MNRAYNGVTEIVWNGVYQMEHPLTRRHVLLLTVIVANILLVVLIWANGKIVIPPSSDARATFHGKDETPSISYEYEFEKSYERDGWLIEQYRLYEVIRDASGEIISKQPEGDVQYMKYWEAQ